jgi:hypothetical protein
MLKIIALLALAGIAGVVIAAALRPNTSRISRSMRIAAAPEAIYPLINELAAFNRWNPFDKKDPKIQGTYQGPASGPGATYLFKGNGQVGEGSIEITEARPAREVRMRLKMVKPMKCDNAVTFSIMQQGAESEVSWTMQGETPYLAKLLHLFIDMDKMCGREFEKGLASLKSLAEANA